MECRLRQAGINKYTNLKIIYNSSSEDLYGCNRILQYIYKLNNYQPHNTEVPIYTRKYIISLKQPNNV